MKNFKLVFASVFGGMFILLGQQWWMYRSENWSALINPIRLHLEVMESSKPGITRDMMLFSDVSFTITLVVGLAMLYVALFDNKPKPSRSS